MSETPPLSQVGPQLLAAPDTTTYLPLCQRPALSLEREWGLLWGCWEGAATSTKAARRRSSDARTEEEVAGRHQKSGGSKSLLVGGASSSDASCGLSCRDDDDSADCKAFNAAVLLL